MPVPNITSAPSPTKQIAKKVVEMYPTLKSKRVSLIVVFFDCILFFSSVHIECQIEISKGAGIQPRKAIKKSNPLSFGNI